MVHWNLLIMRRCSTPKRLARTCAIFRRMNSNGRCCGFRTSWLHGKSDYTGPLRVCVEITLRPHLSTSQPQLSKVPPPHKVCENVFGVRIRGIGRLQDGHLTSSKFSPQRFLVTVPTITNIIP